MNKNKKLPRPPAMRLPYKPLKEYRHYEIKRPVKPGVTLRIWEISDHLTKATGKPAYRKDVLLQAQKEGIPISHASTHYGRWRLANKIIGYLPERTEKQQERALKKLPRPPHAIKQTVSKLMKAAKLDKKGGKRKPKAKLPRPPKIVKAQQTEFAPIMVAPIVEMPASVIPAVFESPDQDV